MGAETAIAWTDHTFNPWWGCVRVSPGCERCYAETWDRRWGGEHWGPNAQRRFFGEAHWNEPRAWNRDARDAGARRRVFCASMADVFEDRPDLDGQRGQLWDLIRETPHLDWQLLTKRPENIRRMLPVMWLDEPMPNVWLGTTVEDQRRADERIPRLLSVPAAVRFLSCEPLLESVDLGAWLPFENAQLGWVIVGGESGTDARPFDVTWADFIVSDCQTAGVPVFVKQLGARPVDSTLCGPNPPRLVKLRDRKGASPSEWPAGLRVREFPEPRR